MDPDTDKKAPEAAAPTPENQSQVDPVRELEALKAKYERAQKDLQTFRTRADEVTAAQKAAEQKALAEADAVKKAELLTAKVAELERAQADALAKAAAAERRAALTGKVNDLALAEAVASKYTSEDGALDVDALLTAHPSLATRTSNAPSTPGAGGTLNGKTAALTSLQERLDKARTREERIALQDEILKHRKG